MNKIIMTKYILYELNVKIVKKKQFLNLIKEKFNIIKPT